MAKNVFKAGELTNLTKPIIIDAPIIEDETEDSVLEVEEVYEGPTVEELKKEADDFIKDWELKKQSIIEQSNIEAKSIIENAKSEALKIREEAEDYKNKILEESESKINDIQLKAQEDAEKIIKEAENNRDTIIKGAKDEGFEKGSKEGYKSGKAEVDRLINKIHIMISGLADKRIDIINESEKLIIELVLNLTKKVIRTISENEKTVIVDTVIKALSKIKNRTDVYLRVNFDDVELTTNHMKTFLSKFEKVKSIQIIEDSQVDRGGCIVETDYGSIDARITTQLREIEDKLMELMPIK